MPRFDGTGPGGQGPRTGWGMGVCPPGGGAGPAGGGYGVGRGGRPRGGGRGRRFGGGRGGGSQGWPAYAPPPGATPAAPWGAAGPAPYAPPTAADERAMLQQQADMLKNQLDAIQARLEELGPTE